MNLLLFYGCSLVIILSALGVILFREPVKALLSLVAVMFGLSILYLALGAPFIAMANLIVYAGAVLVLFLFVIMMQGLGAKDVPLRERFPKAYLMLACFTAVAFTLTLLSLNRKFVFTGPVGIFGTIEKIGLTLFTRYHLQFELTSLLLLLGVLAGISLARKEGAAE